MIFKVFFIASRYNYTEPIRVVRVIAVENGQRLELRIKDAIAALKSEGYKSVEVVDCFNISEPER